jgi:hypothetical protein
MRYRNELFYDSMISLDNKLEVSPNYEQSSGLNLAWPNLDRPTAEFDFWKREDRDPR